MGAKEQVDALLAECGATLTRAKKHEVWLLPNGQKFTRSKTPSDRLTDDNNLSTLKHALGIVKTVATNGTRRVKKLTQGKDNTVTYSKANGSSLADTLRASGVAEQALKDDLTFQRERIAELELALENANGNKKHWADLAVFWSEVAASKGMQIRACWMCRLRGWVKQKREQRPL